MNSCDLCEKEDVKNLKVFEEISFTSNRLTNRRELCYPCFKVTAQKYIAETRARKND